MSKVNDGGPAFPCDGQRMYMETPTSKPEPIGFSGMSLRDYFAAKAMQGDMANPEAGVYSNAAADDDLLPRCGLFYRVADAMLRAREG